MGRAWKVCSTQRCPELVPSGIGRCPGCESAAERRRGTSGERGYGGRIWKAKRRTVLLRDPLCQCTDQTHGHGTQCLAPSTVADHYPDERRDLVASGVKDPDAPHRMVGRCASCHSKRTAQATPGGWNAR